MTPDRDPPPADPSRDPVLDEAFRHLVHHAQAPPHFYPQVLARVAERHAHRRRFAGLVSGAQPVWALALAGVLVLSLTINVYQALAPSTPDGGLPVLITRRRAPTLGTDIAQVLERGDSYATLREYDKALRAYTDVLRAEGGAVAPVLRKMADVYAQAGRYHEAIETATTALLFDPQDARAYRYRGAAYKALGNRPQARQDWHEALRLGDTEAQRLLETLEAGQP